MSTSWFSCLTDPCFEQRRIEAHPQYAQLAAQEIQAIRGRSPQPQTAVHPQIVPNSIQQTYQPQTVSVMPAKVAASEIKT